MKKLVFAVCMIFGAVVVNAQDSTSTQSPTDPTISTESTMTQEQQGRTKIKSQDLPDAVKSSLESQEFRGWLVSSAYKMDASTNITETDKNEGDSTSVQSDSTNVSSESSVGSHQGEVYVVELKNGAQTKTIRFDKDGKKLDDESTENDQK
jgi:hypothetical protein